jgi:hypothetical protein
VTSTDATRANEDLVLKMVMLENIFCTWPPRCDQIDRCSYSGHKSEKSNRTKFLALLTPNNNGLNSGSKHRVRVNMRKGYFCSQPIVV